MFRVASGSAIVNEHVESDSETLSHSREISIENLLKEDTTASFLYLHLLLCGGEMKWDVKLGKLLFMFLNGQISGCGRSKICS